MTTAQDTADWAKIVTQREGVTQIINLQHSAVRNNNSGVIDVGAANTLDLVLLVAGVTSGDVVVVELYWYAYDGSLVGQEYMTTWTQLDGHVRTFWRTEVKAPQVQVIVVVPSVNSDLSVLTYATTRQCLREMVSTTAQGRSTYQGSAAPNVVPASTTLNSYFAPTNNGAQLILGAAPAGCTYQVNLAAANTGAPILSRWATIVPSTTASTVVDVPFANAAINVARVNTTAAAASMGCTVLAKP